MTSTTKKSPLDKSIEFTSTVSGIDKIFKVLVYCSKLVSLREGKGLKSLDSLSSNLTDTRTVRELCKLIITFFVGSETGWTTANYTTIIVTTSTAESWW